MFKKSKGLKRKIVVLMAAVFMIGSTSVYADAVGAKKQGDYISVPKLAREHQGNDIYELTYNGLTTKELYSTFKRVKDVDGIPTYETDQVIEIVIGKDGKVDYDNTFRVCKLFANAISNYSDYYKETGNLYKDLSANNPWPKGLDENNPVSGTYECRISCCRCETPPYTTLKQAFIKVIVRKEGEKTVLNENLGQTEKVDITKVDKTTYVFPDFPRTVDASQSKPGITESKVRKVYSLFEKGIIAGDEYGKLDPFKELSRAEFAKMLVVGLNLSKTGESKGFTDTKGHWAEETINIAVDNGLLKGVAEGKFDPNGKLTVEQVSAIVSRVLEKEGKAPLVTADDVDKYCSEGFNLTWGKASFAMCRKAGIFDEIFYFYPTKSTSKLDAIVIVYELMNITKK